MSDAVTITPEAFEADATAFINMNHNLNLSMFFVAAATDAVLCGIMFIQLTEYFTYSKEDRKFTKIIVMITTFFSAAVTIFVTACMFELFVYHFGQYSQFTSTKLLTYMVLLDLFPSTATQIFFTHRAYKLNHNNKLLGSIIAAFVLMSVTGGIGFVAIYANLDSASETGRLRTKIFRYLWLGGNLGADALITIFIMISLFRSKTGWKSTDRVVTKLMAIVIETQLPPLVIFVFFFITSAKFASSTYLDAFPQWVQSKAYTCGLLASLNSRYSLRRTMNDSSVHGKAKTNAAVVHVLTETYVQRDEAGSSAPLPNPLNFKNDSKKPNFITSNNSNNNNMFSPRRGPAKDPLELDMDDDSIELDRDGSEHKLHMTETEDEQSIGGHKMDYMENGSKTGLTDDKGR